MTNLYVTFQNLLGKEPVTRGEVTIVQTDATVSVRLSNNTVVRLKGEGWSVGDFVYLRGDTVIGKAPSLAITEVII